MSSGVPKRVLLIGWDAADWQMINPLIEAGDMPNMKRFVDEGVSGNVATLQPALSPMLWTSVATGKTADKHGVLGFAEVDPRTGKARPVTSTGRTCKAIWNILSDHGRPAGAINWYASHPAEKIDGFVVTDRFAHPTGVLKEDQPWLGWAPVERSVHPSDDLEDLAKTRVHPQMITHDQVKTFVPGATDHASAGWSKIRELRVLLAHCATVHNAATAFMDARDWDFLGIYYDAIDRFAHAFMEFNPPKMGHVSDEDFALYKGVMDECYRFHDLMLGRLMNMIDEDTAVVILSDHGFHSGATRPEGTSGIADGQPASWHRPYGVIAVWGPGIKRGAKLYGATLLDVAPTILTMLGMKPAHDMDGLPLTQIWEEPRLSTERVQSYEADGTDEREESHEEIDVDEQILHQFRQLGYLGSSEADEIEIDRARNLGTVYRSMGRHEAALEQFQQIRKQKPASPGIGLSIAASLLALGRFADAEQELTSTAGNRPMTARERVLMGMIAAGSGTKQDALDHLLNARETDPTMPGIDTRVGDAFARCGQLNEAETAYERALSLDPEDAEALDGIGVVYQRTDRMPEAVLSHTRSIALVRNRMQSHLHLGEALVRLKRSGWAIEAFVEAARIAPWSPIPHRRLADVYVHLIGNQAKAQFHRDRAEKIQTLLRARKTAASETASATEPISPPALQAHQTRGADASDVITLVSGLPRSGTSLMMQMLAAGGMPVLCDEQRVPDENNPRGYFELDSVKHTASDASWIADAPGRAVKVVHAILRSLPSSYRYRVIFMKRQLDEVVLSQETMLKRLHKHGASLGREAIRTAYAREYEQIGAWLSKQPNFSVHELSYNELIASPRQVTDGVCAFLGQDLDSTAMIEAIDQDLYRSRGSLE